MGTKFSTVYNHFLGKITDDLYMELTPEDTVKDLQNLLINQLSGFEFPRVNLFEYTIETQIIHESELEPDDFLIGIEWNELEEVDDQDPLVIIEKSYFEAELTDEEIDILAILMMIAWTQRQITSIENVRMKYSGSDFKMTSQANHLSKLLILLSETQRQSHHMQRLYKRRKIISNGEYRSNWSVFGEYSATDY